MRLSRQLAGALAFALLACAAMAGERVDRAIPRPSADHPGNIYLAGESIVLPAPPGEVETWRAVDYDNKLAAKGQFKDGKAEIGPLPVGWYKLVRGVGHVTNRAFFCVLEPLRAPTPQSSPICIDVAMAWFFPKEKMGTVANLCRLAGINWVRDRLNWQQMEPKRGEFAGTNQYDASAEIQHAAGLHLLQVNHLSPAWANPNGRRFPLDLRDAYRFYREMARRWRGEIEAFEPWNEADLAMFGGHTGSEMASFQKAAYLGLKAGNPDIIACLNVFAIHRAATLSDFQNNQAWPYFDTFNLHHYERLENYPSLYSDFRAVSAGKPLWVSECSVHVKWGGDETLRELGDEDLQLQSERLTKTYALAIHEGAAEVFYFMLPHYTESKLQYGLLRADLSPRPGYVALAAVGRLLADARALGQVKSDNPAVHAYVFEARPDGKRAEVLVAWSAEGATLELPKRPVACFDHLGRSLPVTNASLQLGRAPKYALLAKSSRPALLPPPEPARRLKGKPGQVVLQAIFPEADIVLEKSAYQIGPAPKRVPLFLYNFGARSARGRLAVETPAGWKASLSESARLEVAAGDRKELQLELSAPEGAWQETDLRIKGDFGAAGNAILTLRLTPPKRAADSVERSSS